MAGPVTSGTPAEDNEMRNVQHRKCEVSRRPEVRCEMVALSALVATTAAGYRTVFGCEASRFRGIWSVDGALIGVEAEGEVASTAAAEPTL